jgi:hypothetical protein
MKSWSHVCIVKFWFGDKDFTSVAGVAIGRTACGRRKGHHAGEWRTREMAAGRLDVVHNMSLVAY